MAQNLDYGKGHGKSYINNAVDASTQGTNGQQAGSTFKIFTVAAAIENGFADGRTDQRAVIPGLSHTAPTRTATALRWRSGPWRTMTGAPAGSYDMRSGAANSVNTYFAELQRRVGLCNVIDMASRAGISDAYGTDPLDDFTLQQNSFTLGAAFEISPLTLAEAYATFAARGVHCEPRSVDRVTTSDDSEVAVPPADCQQAIDPEVADAVNSILPGVIDGPLPAEPVPTCHWDDRRLVRPGPPSSTTLSGSRGTRQTCCRGLGGPSQCAE